MIKNIKIPTIAPTCFLSRRNHHQGAILCLAKTTIMILLCQSLMTWSVLLRHTSLLCKRVVHGRGRHCSVFDTIDARCKHEDCILLLYFIRKSSEIIFLVISFRRCFSGIACKFRFYICVSQVLNLFYCLLGWRSILKHYLTFILLTWRIW